MRPQTAVALGGRYRLVSRIAVGGMGEVWVGHDEALARDVAVKVLREEFAGDAGFLERFRTEARNSAQLSHPNIAQLYDYGEQEGSGFLVMELVLGEPMSDLLDRQPVLPTRRLLPILAQTARALHAAHVAGVVHRDVKPGNILLARSGRVKITDFGISTASNQVPMTASGMVMGTAQYLSPEQAIGRAATPASDIYSLGIVAYEALVGNRPFTGPTAVDIAVAHVNTPVPPLPHDIDPELAAMVMRMLAKDPEERPRSAASLARTLDGMLDRTPPGGVPTAAYGRHARTVDLMDAAEMSRTGTVQHVPRPHQPVASGPVPPQGGLGYATGPLPLHALVDAGPTVVPGRPVAEAVADTPAGAPPVYVPQDEAAAERAVPAPAPTVLPTTPARPGPVGEDSPDAPLARPEAAAWERAAEAVASAPLELPPPAPRTDARRGATPGTPAPGAGPRAPHRTRSPRAVPVRTSTTTGLRWGRVSRPLVALVLVVLFAVLGALFADRVWGQERAAGAAGAMTPVVTSTDGAPGHGMLPLRTLNGGAAQTAAPVDVSPAPGSPAQTTTARNL